jgi:hypothetical protein
VLRLYLGGSDLTIRAGGINNAEKQRQTITNNII